MTPELNVLALSILLQAVQFTAMSFMANRELGPKKTMSPRDGQDLASQLSPKAGRLVRAMNNHFEAMILYTATVVVLVLADKTTGMTGWLAYTYLAARILYVPAYYFGWTPWRSLIWFVGFLATLAMVLSVWVN